MTTIAPTKKRIISRPKVLLVESNRNDLVCLVNALKLLGCDYLIASETMLALSLAQQEQPDLILLDLQLPQINGIKLLGALKIDWLTRNIPIIAITTLKAEKEKNILDAEFDGYLFPPYTLANLQKAIASFLPHALDNRRI